MRFTRYFAALISLIVATSCAYNDIDKTPNINAGEKSSITISGRITPFDDYAVATRVGKTNEESYSSSMAMAIFPIDTIDNKPTLGNCIHYRHLQGSNLNFTVDRAKLRENYGDIYDNKPVALYLFANMSNELPMDDSGLDEPLSLSYFLSMAYNNSSIRRPQTGFPMVGSLGDFVSKGGDGDFVSQEGGDGNFVSQGGDGNTFILIPTEEDGKLKLPTLNGEPSDYIPIPLKSLYAKFSFVISVDPDQHIEDGATPTFTLNSYAVNNIPSKVYADAAKNANHTNVISGGGVTTSVGTSITEGGSLKFEFYLPERMLKPSTLAENFSYPFQAEAGDIDENKNGLRDEDEKYRQRYKPLLVEDEQKATYVTLSGRYKDHQNRDWDVEYDIYLGEDNYSDFNFERNTNYINNVVIRGITASDDQSEDLNGVFIDHRVTIERSNMPVIISLQRETLLDSHFEVRPLRVRYPLAAGQNDVPENAKVTVKVLNEDGLESSPIPDWVRIEHNNGGSATDTHLASGKRKYFTTDLVTNTLKDSVEVVSAITNLVNKHVFWIYVDQCDDDDVAPENDKNKVRKAKIRVEYKDDNTTETKVVEYMLCQHLLYPVVTTRTAADVTGTSVAAGSYTYYIEYEEEYLHNYDSEDDYGATEQAGMEWGLNGVQLSNEHSAFYMDVPETIISDYASGSYTKESVENTVNNAIKALNIDPKYDFYLPRDAINQKLYIRSFDGYEMNKDIATYLKDKYSSHQVENSSNEHVAKIDRITLEEKPKSAYAYCYNRNKRQTDGTVKIEDIVWYLPAIDEIEDIMENAYGDFETEFQGNMYWSSQPSYIKTYVNIVKYSWVVFSGWACREGQYGDGPFGGYYYTDDKESARATKALREDGVFVGVPNSGADVFQQHDGKFYLSKGIKDAGFLASNSDKNKNETVELPSPYIVNTNYKDIAKYPGNMPRTGKKARVRCVRKKEN